MKNKVTRRTVLKTGAAAAVVVATGATPVLATCKGDHKKMGYRLGALLVDPSVDEKSWDKMVADANCPHCSIKIKPLGLSYSEHMPG